MTTVPRVTVQFETTPEHRARLEAEAARLNLTVGAYIQMLQSRQKPGRDAVQFDRVIQQVFGRYGQTMRNLAK